MGVAHLFKQLNHEGYGLDLLGLLGPLGAIHGRPCPHLRPNHGRFLHCRWRPGFHRLFWINSHHPNCCHSGRQGSGNQRAPAQDSRKLSEKTDEERRRRRRSGKKGDLRAINIFWPKKKKKKKKKCSAWIPLLLSLSLSL